MQQAQKLQELMKRIREDSVAADALLGEMIAANPAVPSEPPTRITGPDAILTHIVLPPLRLLAAFDERMGQANSHVLLVAIAGQEASWEHRHQINGPAHGLWQFEKLGGTAGVITHSSTAKAAQWLCDMLSVPFSVIEVFDALEGNDFLACGFARLLLWTDPRPLPSGEDESWEYYLDTWRPGRPRRDRWTSCWREAVRTVDEA